MKLYNKLWTKVLFVASKKHRYRDYLEQKYPYPTINQIKENALFL